MIVATRQLTFVGPNGEHPLPIRIHAPQPDGPAWSCRYEIDWPEGTEVRAAGGFDSVQALLVALQMVGTDLYTSNYHKAGQLFFEKPGAGYGFPVPSTIRDLRVGNDKAL